MTRIRLRFSLRTLAVFVTLVCAYFGVWEATKRYGLGRGIESWGCDQSSPLPLVIANDEHYFCLNGGRPGIHRQYYIWLLGPQFKLPWESDWVDE
jgi:hypothetical protein